jgi:hypothetical protein
VASALRSFWDTPFTMDFEVPRGSDFTRSRDLDARISSVAHWEQASVANPLFPLSVAWPDTGLTLQEAVAESLLSAPPPRFPASVEELADILYRIPPA